MLSIILSNSHFGKRLGAGDMIIFGSNVEPRIPNIGDLKAYGGIWRYMNVFGSI